MKGAVHAINSELGLVAVDTSTGFSVFEQTSNEFEIGDFVEWHPDMPIGSGLVRNVTRGRDCRVYFQNHAVPGTFLKVNLNL